MITRHPDLLRGDIARVLSAAGADARNVEIVAGHLTGAELCGVQTHGSSRFRATSSRSRRRS